jgi:hypothetical protein
MEPSGAFAGRTLIVTNLAFHKWIVLMKAVWTCENAGIGLLTQQAHYENSPAAPLTPASLISAFQLSTFPSNPSPNRPAMAP